MTTDTTYPLAPTFPVGTAVLVSDSVHVDQPATVIESGEHHMVLATDAEDLHLERSGRAWTEGCGRTEVRAA